MGARGCAARSAAIARAIRASICAPSADFTSRHPRGVGFATAFAACRSSSATPEAGAHSRNWQASDDCCRGRGRITGCGIAGLDVAQIEAAAVEVVCAQVVQYGRTECKFLAPATLSAPPKWGLTANAPAATLGRCP